MNVEQQLDKWYPSLEYVFRTEWMQRLGRRLGAAKDVQPSLDKVFRAFTLCAPGNLKVVILGQDPYPNGQADGLAFSSFGRSTPSLDVILGEINRTHTCPRTMTWFDDWAGQGVLLLNTVLTTTYGQVMAHRDWGWEQFTAAVMAQIAQLPQPIIVMAWGSYAQSIARRYVQDKGRYVLKAYHPAAQKHDPTRKFIGCNHFVLANKFLLAHQINPIWWSDMHYLDKRYGNRYQELIDNLRKIPLDDNTDFRQGLCGSAELEKSGNAADHAGLQL